MRHARKINTLSRTSSHRKAMMSNMANSLLLHKRIHTTVAKAKALRKYVEPLITRSKEDTTHSRRVVFSYLRDKKVVSELYAIISNKVGQRPGGYTRIIRLGTRKGDAAELCMMELVDFNPWMVKEEKKAKRTRSRRGGSAKKARSSESVDTPELSAESADTSELSAESADTSELSAESVDTSELSAESVDTPELSAESVDTSELSAESVDTSELSAESVDTSELSAESVDTSELSAESVDTSELSAESVDTSELSAGPSDEDEASASSDTSSTESPDPQKDKT